jgi:LexA-binding, inner membrane-associated putative hydrolase
MFLGHYAAAFGAKRAAPDASLGLALAAAQLPDLLWPVFLLLGIERVAPGDRGFLALSFTHYPWSHSLLMTAVWALLAALAYGALTRSRRAAMAIALLVLSHWVLDYVTHVPDLPLYPGGGPKVGLGLWRSPAGTAAVEGLMTVAGLWLYVTATRPRDGIGRWALVALVALLLTLYSTNFGGSAPADVRGVAWFGMAGWLVPLWGAWVDRHRRVAGEPEPAPPR